MARRTLPLLFINLGGEMIYILNQRLGAQAIETEKAGKVINDIVSTMFNRKFIDEIFQEHLPIYSRRVLKTMFEKLAHASIMRLNVTSMNKLYDLMTMTVKYQVLMCHNPRHIISITLNHLDTIMGFVTSNVVQKNVELAFQHTVRGYGEMTIGELQAVRHSLLNFLQDINVRVSIFLQEKLQHRDGRFVLVPNTVLPPGVELPGNIRLMDPLTGEVANTVRFHPGQMYDFDPGLVAMEIGGKRSTQLGSNIYRDRDKEGRKEQMEAVRRDLEMEAEGRRFGKEETGGDLAREELNLLAKLIGTETDVNKRDIFKLNWFDGELGEQEESQEIIPEDKTLKIDLKTRRSRGDLDRIISEMAMREEGGEEEDLLSLMDKAV